MFLVYKPEWFEHILGRTQEKAKRKDLQNTDGVPLSSLPILKIFCFHIKFDNLNIDLLSLVLL